MELSPEENEALHAAAKKFAKTSGTSVEYALDLMTKIINAFDNTAKNLDKINRKLNRVTGG